MRPAGFPVGSVRAAFRLVARVGRRIREEGFKRYVATRWGLGLHRYYLARIVRRGRLKANSIMVAGYSLTLPPNRSGIVEELLLFGVHEPVASSLYSRLLSEGDVVLDVGSNLGYYMAIASRAIGPSGQIWAFEPDPELWKVASKNAMTLSCKAVVWNMAVADRTGVATFYRSAMPNWGTLNYSPYLRPVDSTEVDCVRLDDLCARQRIRPTVIRMDIEGGEVAALAGARAVLEEYCPKLFIEIHPFLMPSSSLHALLEVFADSGYRTLTIVERTMDWPWVTPSRRCKAVRTETIQGLLSSAKNGKVPPVFSVLAGHPEARA